MGSIRDYAIFMVDSQGYVVGWNKEAEDIMGYTADEVIGQHISTFYRKEENDHGEAQRNLQIAKEMEQFEEEGWRIRKEGSPFWAKVLIYVFDYSLLIGNGHNAGFIKSMFIVGYF